MFPLLARTAFRIQEHMLGRRTFAILDEMEQSQYWPRERIEQLQLRRLQDLVAVAYAHTPFWRSVMDQARIQPSDIRSLSDVQRFPLLDKETVRARREDMVWREGRRRLMLARTSGSTNEALQFYTDSPREAHINAARIRGHRWIGINKGDREMYFWGSPVELGKQHWVKSVRDRLVNDGLTNGFAVSPELVQQYFAKWLRWRPECIFGYANSVILMALMARAQGLDLTELKRRGLRAICVTSEMLTDTDRCRVRDAFGVPVYDSYGIREGGLIGHECSHFTMHTTDEQILLETLDPKTLEPTEGEGELVLTNLVSTVMPMIRYRTGDLVMLARTPCPCGRTLNRVSLTGGRLGNAVVTSDGSWIPGTFFLYLCRPMRGIVKFQAVQERLGEIRLLLVIDDEFPSDGKDQLMHLMRPRLSQNDVFVVQIVADIPPAPSGKHHLVVSRVAEQMLHEARDANPKSP